MPEVKTQHLSRLLFCKILYNTDLYGFVEFDVSVKNLDSFYKYFKKLREENVNSEQNNTDK